MKTDISTLLGIGLATLLTVAAIVYGGDIKSFFDLPSVMIVVGGTLATTTACYSLPEMLRAQGIVLRTIFYGAENLTRAGEEMLGLAEEARKNGVISLQNVANAPDGNPFLKKGLSMAVDNMEPEAIEYILKQDVAAMADRHAKGAAILRKSAEISPAMGLIGTLIGLVQMLGNLEDPSKIGPAMAVALLTTLYGAFLAYVVFSPLAAKLERNSREEVTLDMMYIKGIVSIAKKENPRRLEMVLNTILPPAQRIKYFD